MRLRLGFSDLTDGGWQGNASGAQREACGRAWRGAQHEPLSVLFDLGFGQGVEVSEDLGPRTEVRDAVLQRLLQHQGEKAGRHVTADRLVEPSPDTVVVNGLTEQAPDVL
jgi:hypothetical protein